MGFMTMLVSGFTIIRNGVKFGYPFLESIRSLLPLVDELVIVAGDSVDSTNEALASLDSDKVKVLHSVWDPELRQGGLVMSQQTNLALDECTGDWCFYLQADEVIHEKDYDVIRASMKKHLDDPKVEGLYFRYKHFMGSYDIINPLAYRHQVRIVRNNIGIRSIRDACGFSRSNGKNMRVRIGYPIQGIDADIYHYGWVRPPLVMQEKTNEFVTFYHGEYASDDVEEGKEWLYNFSTCRPFKGTHPAAMHEVISNKDWDTPIFKFVPAWRNPAFWLGRLKKIGLFRAFKRKS